MAKICKNWYELDDANGLYEFCSGKETRCACAGVEQQCKHLEYFNQPKKVCKRLREKVV